MNARTVIATVLASASHRRICPMVRLAVPDRNACRANASTASVATQRVPVVASPVRQRSKVKARTVSAGRSSTTSIPKKNASTAPATELAPANSTTAFRARSHRNACRTIASTTSAAEIIAAELVMPVQQRKKAADPTAFVGSSRTTPIPTMNALAPTFATAPVFARSARAAQVPIVPRTQPAQT